MFIKRPFSLNQSSGSDEAWCELIQRQMSNFDVRIVYKRFIQNIQPIEEIAHTGND